jgi:FkbM family methyltransferase
MRHLIYLRELIDRGIHARDRMRSGALGQFNRHGGRSLLVDGLDLNSNDWVLDGGGYLGWWTEEIIIRYGVRSVVVEPNPPFAASLRKRYLMNDRIEVIEGALGDASGNMLLHVRGDGSTVVPSGAFAELVSVQVVDVKRLIRERFNSGLGCLKLNVEGSEYEILEQLISSDLIGRIRMILIQFHRNVDDYELRRKSISTILLETHNIVFEFPFVWELWKIK